MSLPNRYAMEGNQMKKESKSSTKAGISRVLQKKGEYCGAQGGAMSMTGHGEKGTWKRSGASLTPRKA